MIQTMKKYPAYKDSGIEWLGVIPEGWSIRRFKFLFDERNERNCSDTDELLSVSQYTGVTKMFDRTEKGDIISRASSLDDYKKVYKNDLVSNIMLAWNGSLGFSSFNGITSPAYSVYKLKEGHDIKYFHYLVRSEIYKSVFKRNSTGVIESRLRLYTDDFYNIFSVLPPYEEQTTIGHFLDTKTTQIDNAIVQKEQMIELLKERKQIVIQNAVTGKWSMIDGKWTETPKEQMKDSEVEWIGEVPEGWEVKRLSSITTKIGDGLHGTPEYTDDTEYYFINGNNLGTGFIEITEQTKTVSQKEYILNKKDIHQDKTLLLSINGTIGNVAFYRNETVMLGKSAAYLNFINGVNLEFIKWFLMSESFINYYELELSGSTINNLSLFSIGKTPLTYPSKNEQERIVDYINVETLRIDRAIILQQSQIEKLKEYKATLIDGAVTGKIRVS